MPTAAVDGQSFAWPPLSPKRRQRARRATSRVRRLLRDSAGDLIRIGREITVVRALVRGRTFSRWVKAFTPYSRSHCYRLMNAHKVFGGRGFTDQFEPTALWLLSQPSVPVEAHEYAAKLARENGTVTAADAREILLAHRTNPEVLSARAAAVRRHRETHQVEAYTAIRAELLKGATLHVTLVEDGEADPMLYGSLQPADPGRPAKYATHKLLSYLLLDLTDAMPLRQCRRCEARKPVALFSADENQADGLNRYCMTCERVRLRNRTRDRREAAELQPA